MIKLTSEMVKNSTKTAFLQKFIFEVANTRLLMYILMDVFGLCFLYLICNFIQMVIYYIGNPNITI